MTVERPKVLLPLVNVAMIDYTLEWLVMNGVAEVRRRTSELAGRMGVVGWLGWNLGADSSVAWVVWRSAFLWGIFSNMGWLICPQHPQKEGINIEHIPFKLYPHARLASSTGRLVRSVLECVNQPARVHSTSVTVQSLLRRLEGWRCSQARGEATIALDGCSISEVCGESSDCCRSEGSAQASVS